MISFYLEKLAYNKKLSENVIWYCGITNLTILSIYPYAITLYLDSEPLISCLILSCNVIILAKLWSYHHVNRNVRMIGERI